MNFSQSNVAALCERRIHGEHPQNQRRSQTAATRRIAMRLVISVWLAAVTTAMAQETWQSALSRMPLGTHVTELNRTNCTQLMLNAFQSNAVVKALIFLPGATDELYFYRRAQAKLTNANPSLLDAVVALTNQTYIRAAFRPPLLLLHTTEDPLNVITIVKNKSTAAKLHRKIVPDRVVFNDTGWDEIRTALGPKLSIGLRPFSNAPISWHFYRHNFAACGVTEWQMLQTIAFSDKTKFTVHWLTVDFQLDQRAGAVPDEKGIRLP